MIHYQYLHYSVHKKRDIYYMKLVFIFIMSYAFDIGSFTYWLYLKLHVGVKYQLITSESSAISAYIRSTAIRCMYGLRGDNFTSTNKIQHSSSSLL